MTAAAADDVLAVLRDAVSIVLELEPAAVTRAARLVEDLGADSLAVVEIVEILEERLAPIAVAGFHVDDEDLDAMTTVGDVVDYALARLEGRPR